MRKPKKNSFKRLVLEKAEEFGKIYFDIFFPPAYSYTKISRKFWGMDRPPKISRRTFSSLMSQLKKEGLISLERDLKNSSWDITKKGKSWLQNNSLEPPKADGVGRLVIFDIPERERRKRDVVRAELTSCNFKQLQKSVWVGYNPLPNNFLTVLDDLNLHNKVHIFSIKEDGTLKNR